MNFLRTHLMLITGSVLVGLLVIGAYYYLQGNNSSETLTALPASGLTSNTGASLIDELNQLQNVRLNGSILSQPAFQSLLDFSVVIPPQPIGNADPFAPLSGVGSASLPQNITSGTAKN